jgi:hypothetical protein
MAARIPPGAFLDRAEAGRIAADPARLSTAHAYWDARLAALGENVLTTGTFTSAAMALAAAAPDSPLSGLVPETAHVFDFAVRRPGRGVGDKPVSRSGCLVSLKEITRFVGLGTAPDALADALDAVTAAATASGPSPPAETVAKGLIGCREVFDAVRRYDLCGANAAVTNQTLPVLMALYRQEGGLCVSPPASSYPHSPLINTAPETCRPDDVPFEFVTTESRVGFNFTYEQPGVDGTTLDGTSQAFGLTWRNMLTLGGIDSIFRPRLSAGDEVRHVLARASTAAPPIPALESLRTAIRAKLNPFQRQLFGEMLAGLLMCELDSLSADSLPEPIALLDTLRAAASGLVTAHVATRRGNEIMLTATDDAAEARAVLALQARWFDSRSRLTTLLARTDRAGAVAFNPLPPFMAYLRFNVGDAIFAGILLRAIGALEAARTAATVSPWPHADQFLNALSASFITHPDVLRARKLVRDHWKPKVGTETAWRHIGLVDELRQVGVPPVWLTTAPAPMPVLLKTADVARELVDILVRTDAIPVIDRLLYTAPISKTIALGVMDALPVGAKQRLPLVKAHSFDRLRIVYEKAAQDAGLLPQSP